MPADTSAPNRTKFRDRVAAVLAKGLPRDLDVFNFNFDPEFRVELMKEGFSDFHNDTLGIRIKQRHGSWGYFALGVPAVLFLVAKNSAGGIFPDRPSFGPVFLLLLFVAAAFVVFLFFSGIRRTLYIFLEPRKITRLSVGPGHKETAVIPVRDVTGVLYESRGSPTSAGKSLRTISILHGDSLTEIVSGPSASSWLAELLSAAANAPLSASPQFK